MTSYFRYDPDVTEDSVYSIFQANINNSRIDPKTLIHQTGTDGLDLIPAALPLATMERQTGKADGMGLVIKNALQYFKDDYDYVLIDCPPVLGILLVNALAACEHLIVPVQTEFLALKGLERMSHTLAMILKARKNTLTYTVVPTMFDRRTRASNETLSVLRRNYQSHLWEDVIPIDTKLREAARAGIPPSSYDPRSSSVVAYSKLLDYLRGL
jgi:chromosome partitioning protein